MAFKRFSKKVAAFLLAIVLLFSGIVTGKIADVKVYAYDTGYPNTWVNTGNQIEDLIGVALTQVGYWGTEYGTGTKYGAWFGNTYAPWCGIFISWCANQAGIPTSVILKSARAVAYKDCGTYHYKDDYTPQRGDIVLYNPNDGAGYYFPSKDSSGKYTRSQHVAIVCSYNAATDEITIVHGNGTGDRVCHEKKKVKSNIAIQAFVTPNYNGSSGSSGSTPSAPSVSIPTDSDYINGSGVRLRSEMSTSSSIVATLNKGTAVKILSSANDSSGNKWYHIEVPSINKKGYVYGMYVTAVNFSDTTPDATPKDNAINSDNIRLRDGPSTSGTKTVTYLYKGQALNILATVKDANGDTWYQVSLTKGGTSYTGYVFGKYVTVADLPSDIPVIDANADIISQNSVNLRKTPSKNGEIVTSLNTGQVIKIASAAYDENGDVWYKVTLKRGSYEYNGYVFASLVSLKTDKDSIEFENSILTVSFDANGGSDAPNSIKCTSLKSATLPATYPQKNGSIFTGWAESNSASEKNYSAGMAYEFSSDITLYAVWISEATHGVYDVDANYWLSEGDIVLLRKQLLKTESKNMKNDNNKDGKLNAADFGALKKVIADI